MITVFAVLGLLFLALPIIAVVALVRAIALGGQLRNLDLRLAALEANLTQRPAGGAVPSVPPQGEPIATPSEPTGEAPVEPSAPDEPERGTTASLPVASPAPAP